MEKQTFNEFVTNSWNKIKKEIKNDKNIEEFDDSYFINSVSSIIQVVSNRPKELQKEFLDKYEIELKLNYLFLTESFMLFHTLDKKFGVNSRDSEYKNHDSKEVFQSLSLLLHQINNSIACHLSLLERGYNFQANIIFRNIIETGNLITAILLDGTFHKTYKELEFINDEEEQLKFWNKNLKPGKVNAIIKNNYTKYLETENEFDFIHKLKKDLYSKTSKYVHTSFITSVFNSYSSNDNTDNIDINVFGRIDTNLKSTLDSSNFYFKVFYFDILNLVTKAHNFTFNKENGEFSIVYTHLLIDQIFKNFYLDEVKSIKPTQ